MKLNQLGRFEEAVECYGRALDLKPDANGWNEKGWALMVLNRYEEASSALIALRNSIEA
jgi:tetratricopeptide (TPR) repeat protein